MADQHATHSQSCSRFEPTPTRTEYRCRWCGRKRGDWHDKECGPGQDSDGHVLDRHCMRLEYALQSQDDQRHLMHEQQRARWDAETEARTSKRTSKRTYREEASRYARGGAQIVQGFTRGR